MGQLQKARVSRDKANIRTVKEAAVVAIMNDEKYDMSGMTSTTKFYVSANVKTNGDMKITQISTVDTVAESTPGKIAYDDTETANVFAILTVSDISAGVKTTS